MVQVEIPYGSTSVQVFKADSEKELIEKLTKAQRHSTEHILKMTRELRQCKSELLKVTMLLGKISASIAAGNEPVLIQHLNEVVTLTSKWMEQ